MTCSSGHLGMACYDVHGVYLNLNYIETNYSLKLEGFVVTRVAHDQVPRSSCVPRGRSRCSGTTANSVLIITNW